MYSFSILNTLLFFLHLLPALAANPLCPCGWLIKEKDSNLLFTHRIYNNFARFPDVHDILTDPKAKLFTSQWLVNGYKRPGDNPAIRLDIEFDTKNVEIINGELRMRQQAYSLADAQTRKAVSIAGLQSRSTDILHGRFTVNMKLEGENGGAVASMFWYHDDSSEVDIEVVTRGTSIVNGTINYTSHPSVNADGSPIPDATRSVPLPNDDFLSKFHQYRFDCSPQGVQWYLDGVSTHVNTHHIPTSGGTLQMNLWADGNTYWSGRPSTTDVVMTIKNILVYYNTTDSAKWLEGCKADSRDACKEDDHLDVDDSIVQRSVGNAMVSRSDVANLFPSQASGEFQVWCGFVRLVLACLVVLVFIAVCLV